MGKVKAQYSQKYRQEWETDPVLKDWIKPAEGNKSSAYCKYCHCILKAHYKSLTDHSETKKHRDAAEPFSIPRFKKVTDTFKPAEKFKTEVLASEAGMALFVTCHCAIRNVDHLTQLNKKIFSTAKGAEPIHLGRTKCTGVIRNIIAPHFRSELLEDIGDGPYS